MSQTTKTFQLPGKIRARHSIGPFEYEYLLPNTKYKVFYKNYDVTRWCRGVKNSKISANRYNTDTLTSNENGQLQFKLHIHAWHHKSNSDLYKLYEQLKDKDDIITLSLVPEYLNLLTSNTTIGNNTLNVVTTKSPDIDSNNKKISGITTTSITDNQVIQNLPYNFIQSFFLDPNSVNSSKTVDITDVKLYFKAKPTAINTSGYVKPNVTIALVDMKENSPVINTQYNKSIVTLDYTQIYTSSDASAYTEFTFTTPITLETGRYYGVAIILGDAGYELWQCKQGDRLVGTNDPASGGSSEHKGDLFTKSNTTNTINNTNYDNVFNKRSELDLKFDLSVAKYNTSSDINVDLVNKDYEFFTVGNITGDFLSGEYVYQNVANSTGTIVTNSTSSIVTGTSTTFTSDINDDDYIVLVANSTTSEAAQVLRVISDTELELTETAGIDISGGAYKATPMGSLFYEDLLTNKMYLIDSTSNTSSTFGDGNTIVGVYSGATTTITSIDDFGISAFMTDIEMTIPSTGRISANYYLSNTSYYIDTTGHSVDFINANYVEDYTGILTSKSNEYNNTTNLFDSDSDSTGDKSLRLNVDLQYAGTGTTSYSVPNITTDYFYLTTSGWNINNDTTNEHTNNGNALTKSISKKLTFDSGRSAEDIRVIYNAYKPYGTDFKVYAKIINDTDPDAFDDKSWTELEILSGQGQFSSLSDKQDIREYEFGFPKYPHSSATLAGTVDTSGGNTSVIGVGTEFDNDLVAGDIIKIYSPLFPDNYGIFSIASVDSNTALTLSDSVSNVNIQDSGLKIDTLSTPYTAFNNSDNYNIVRYFNSTGESYDTYSTVAIKTVLLSNTTSVVPKIDDFRVIGVSS